MQVLVHKEKLVSDNNIFALAKKKFADFFANNHIDTPFYLFGILKSFFFDKFKFNRPYIIDPKLDINKGVDLIKQHFAKCEYLNTSEIKEFIKDKDITVYSFIDLINCLDEFYWADKQTLVNVSKVPISEALLVEIEQVISMALGENDFAEIAKLNLINSLPPIGISWTSWLIYAIIYRNSTNFEVSTSSNYYADAVPLIMKSDINVDYVREQISENCVVENRYEIDDLSDIDKLIEGLIDNEDL